MITGLMWKRTMVVPKHSNPYYSSIVSLMNECHRERDKTIKEENTEKFDEIHFDFTTSLTAMFKLFSTISGGEKWGKVRKDFFSGIYVITILKLHEIFFTTINAALNTAFLLCNMNPWIYRYKLRTTFVFDLQNPKFGFTACAVEQE